jgi:hypothetical protein
LLPGDVGEIAFYRRYQPGAVIAGHFDEASLVAHKRQYITYMVLIMVSKSV